MPDVPEENYWFRRHEAAYRFALRAARPPVVDAGSGEGYGAAMLARSGTTVGLDLDPAALAHARERYPSVGFARADLCRLPVRSAGTVVALQVVEHLYCPAEFLAACGEVLDTDGTVVVSTPNRDTFPAGLNPSHIHEYDAGELDGLLGSHFRSVRILGLHPREWLRMLDRAIREPVQRRLVREPWPELPRWLRGALRGARPGHFVVRAEPDDALDLVALCRHPR